MAIAARAAATRRRAAALDDLLQQAWERLVGSPRQALGAANRAVALADAGFNPDPAQQAAARQARGDALRFLGQHQPALLDYARAGELFRELRRAADAARTDASAVDSLRCLGRFAEALHLAKRARRALKQTGEELRTAVLDEIVGLVYMQQNDYARALRLFDRARPVIAAAGRPIDLAVLNNNAATTLTNLDRLREAQTLYAAARAAYAEQGTDAALARIDVNLGYLAFRQGRYGAAVDLLRRAADVFDAQHNTPVAIATRLDLVDTYLALNLLDEAGALSQEQLRLADDYGLVNEHARALFYLSTQRGRLGRYDDALRGLAEAETEFAKHDNLVWRTRCAVGRAALLLADGSPSAVREALALSRRAARVFARLGLPSRQAVASALQARSQLRAGRVRAAGEDARSAVWLAQGLGVPWLLFECHYILGRVLRASGESDRAYVAYREAADALERVRAELQPEELRMSFVSDKTDVYQELVALCLERSHPGAGPARVAGSHPATEEALQHAERAKSRAFAERMAGWMEPREDGRDAQLVGTSDARLLQRMRELRDELVWRYSRLSEGAATDAVQRLRSEVSARETELMRLQRRLQPASRTHAVALGLADPSVEAMSTLERLRRRLQPGRVVLEYFQTGNELVLFTLSDRLLVARRLGPMAGVSALVDRFRFQVNKFRLGEGYVHTHADALLSSVNQILSQLYATLIEPSADELISAAQVVVVPHGALHYLPFHTLMDPTGTPLGERVEISYAPSSTVLASCLERPSVPERSVSRLLVGVSDPAIPRVAGEIAALKATFGAATVLDGADATEQSFRRHAPHASLIHLASHAVFRQDNPLFSAIKLADGWLSLYDLYGMRLSASLVTLSACETGVNDVLAGDELVGLARGFFQAGAASVVVSLWAVNDASTAVLMQHFYSHLETRLGPAAAMRRAQLDLRRDYPHPYHWAPFVVIGRP